MPLELLNWNCVRSVAARRCNAARRGTDVEESEKTNETGSWKRKETSGREKNLMNFRLKIHFFLQQQFLFNLNSINLIWFSESKRFKIEQLFWIFANFWTFGIKKVRNWTILLDFSWISKYLKIIRHLWISKSFEIEENVAIFVGFLNFWCLIKFYLNLMAF